MSQSFQHLFPSIVAEPTISILHESRKDTFKIVLDSSIVNGWNFWSCPLRSEYPVSNVTTGHEAFSELHVVLQIPVYMNEMTQLSCSSFRAGWWFSNRKTALWGWFHIFPLIHSFGQFIEVIDGEGLFVSLVSEASFFVVYFLW